ncbi:MAG: YdbL family protein [Alphaproteobacteria bacterium]
MIRFLRPLILVLACILALGGGVSPGVAQDEELHLRDGRAKGVVGETARGYVAPVGTPTPEITQLVNRVNAARRQRYEQVARETGTPLPDVEVLAAQKIFERLPSGAFVQSPSGWTPKR